MRPLTSLTAKRESQPKVAVPPAAQAPMATCQRDLVVWSLLVCPRPDKA
jgi:hypothetical protein